MNSFFSFAQNRIELVTNDCSQENGFTMFLLDRAKPKILTEQKFEQEEKYWNSQKKILLNNSDILKIEYTNIFGQIIDTTFTNAKELNEIKICVNKFKDYEKKSLIKESIQNDQSWVLNSTWGHQTFESDKLILKPKKGFLKYKYYKNGKRIKRGKIKITEFVIDKIALFERKLNLMKNVDNSCNFGINYNLNNGIEKINFQDDSCSGFSNEQLLSDLKISE
ncbi:hypothetical protein BW723_15770 [Polaribacter reichenbachii]|uniref:Uncharacterized protein n=1 Tax=Polaribacter reichenbachii TaxID=996801 RepID=A0A1B8U551_9FLAO|nr:hypothetical protein [Polaribacter reichenbachii]APZ47657.1 hypothetical protein BW723_15770 [Polaribacter reichenbachii]AUC18297.1 hypothetical protein BTO17_06215 [Polaribacter reichenbachii]OBY66990.1 hypothetical protein LPB301_04015 [Polaribacter reichenbachii]